MGLSSSPYTVTSPQIEIKSSPYGCIKILQGRAVFWGGNKNFFVVCPKKAPTIASFALEKPEKRQRTAPLP